MEKSNFITPWQEVHTIVDDAMAKGDRTVTIYISPDGGMSISVMYEIMAKEMGISLHCPNYIDISRLRPEKGQKR